MQYLFAFIQVALILAQLLLLRRHRQGRTILIWIVQRRAERKPETQ
jgi:hypothetical protein